jgi:CHAT domain-containing protein
LLPRYEALMHGSAVIRGARVAAPAQKASERVLSDLYTALWSPIEQALGPETQRVLLAPDGRLNFVSFATLVDSKGRFLAETRDLSYVSSARDLLLTNPPPKSRSVELVYNPHFDLEEHTLGRDDDLAAESRAVEDLSFPPLPGTRDEGETLAKVFLSKGLKTHTLAGPRALEGSLRKISSPYIVHLATHGFFLPEEGPTKNWNPMKRAGLALTGAQHTAKLWLQGKAPDAAQDGILSAEEVASLKLQGTWLVSLSACDTGAGESLTGEGVMGLRRAVVMAGAQNLLMTLWPVADKETAEIMRDFYVLALETGQAPAALNQVQRKWLLRLRKARGLSEAARLAGPFVLLTRGPVGPRR